MLIDQITKKEKYFLSHEGYKVGTILTDNKGEFVNKKRCLRTNPYY